MGFGRGFGYTSRLPANLKRLEVRLVEKVVRTSAPVWTAIINNILSTLATAADEEGDMCCGASRRLALESVVLELPQELLCAIRNGPPSVVLPSTSDEKPRRITPGQKLRQRDTRHDLQLVERAEALKAYCASACIDVDFILSPAV